MKTKIMVEQNGFKCDACGGESVSSAQLFEVWRGNAMHHVCIKCVNIILDAFLQADMPIKQWLDKQLGIEDV